MALNRRIMLDYFAVDARNYHGTGPWTARF
jgi:hypothetical protein